MKDIRQLIKQRDNIYRNQTIVAFDIVHPTLEGVEEYLISIDPSYGYGVFSWEEIAIHEDDGLLMLLGFVNYEPDQEFLMGGEMVEITKDNAAYFQRVLRIGIPLSVVQTNSKEGVIQFLLNLNEAIAEDKVEDPTAVSLKADTTEHLDFNLDDLTDEQKAALKMFETSEKLN